MSTATTQQSAGVEMIAAEDRRRAVQTHGEDLAASQPQCRALRNMLAHPKVPEGPRCHARIHKLAAPGRRGWLPPRLVELWIEQHPGAPVQLPLFREAA